MTCLNIAYKCEGANEKFKNQKLLLGTFLGNFSQNGERFGPQELPQAGPDLYRRLHVLRN